MKNTNTASETTAPAAALAVVPDPLADPKLPGAMAELRALADNLEASYVERRNPIRVALVALLAREHMIQFGPPGVAKSAILRSLCEALYDAEPGAYFEITLNKFSTPEDLFGPVSASQLLNADTYTRLVDGYAPSARIWFLDEPFQSSTAILHTLVTCMQERKFKNGRQVLDLVLDMICAATNEYPEDASLAKVYDRFALRVWVDEVRDRDNRRTLYRRRGALPVTAKLSTQNLEVLREAVRAVPWGDREADKLAAIQEAVEAEGFKASPRTWVKASWIIPAAAVLAGRTQVQASDYMILADMIWREAGERDRLATVVGNAADPYGARSEAILDGVRAAMKELPSMDLLKSGQKTKIDLTAAIAKVSGQVSAKRDQLDEVIAEAGNTDSLREAVEAVEAAQRQVDKLNHDVTWFRAR
ncbi:MAG: AAA family ATPase [Bacteroidales bacterium]|jgi:MoxR-like ATPase|nr:AAA family ATPase [Bacteroidales bacterium]